MMVTKIVRKKIPKAGDNVTPAKNTFVEETPIENGSVQQSNVLYEKIMRGKDYIAAVTTKMIETHGIGNPFTDEVYHSWGRDSWVRQNNPWDSDNEFSYTYTDDRAIFLKKQEKRVRIPFTKKCGAQELVIYVNNVTMPVTQKQIDSLIDHIHDDNNRIMVLASEKGVKTDIQCLHPNLMFVLVDLKKNIVTMDPRFEKPSYARTMFGVNYDWIFYPNNISHDKWERLYQNSKKIQYLSDFVNEVNI